MDKLKYRVSQLLWMHSCLKIINGRKAFSVVLCVIILYPWWYVQKTIDRKHGFKKIISNTYMDTFKYSGWEAIAENVL